MVLALVVFVVVSLAHVMWIVPQSQMYVVECLGRFQAVIQGGFHLLAPFMGRVIVRIDLHEQVANLPS